MKKLLSTSFILMLLHVLSVPARAQDHTSMQHQTHFEHKMFNEDKLQWQDAPPGLPPGAKVAILEGDPSKEGPFTLRAMLPANYTIAPHWHPTTEHLTILEGVLYMGTGEKLDRNRATMLTKGGFAVMPAKTNHYVFTKDKVVFQVHGNGPFQITYINPADDPRNKTTMH